MPSQADNYKAGPAPSPYDVLERERPEGTEAHLPTDGYPNFPRPDIVSDAVAATEDMRGIERSGARPQVVGHIANQASGIENLPSPQ